GSLFLVPFFLERMLGRAPNEAGLLLSPLPLALGVLAPLAGLLTDRVGPVLPTVTGMGCAAAALLVLAAAPLMPVPALLATLALLGVGLGLFTPPNNSAIMASAPPNRLGVASGVLNMTRSLGTSLGIAATGAVFSLRLEAHAGHPVESTTGLDPAALLPAFQAPLPP